MPAMHTNPKHTMIKDRDLVHMAKDRGGVVGVAQVTSRIREGTVHMYESSSLYKAAGGNSYEARVVDPASGTEKSGTLTLDKNKRLASFIYTRD